MSDPSFPKVPDDAENFQFPSESTIPTKTSLISDSQVEKPENSARMQESSAEPTNLTREDIFRELEISPEAIDKVDNAMLEPALKIVTGEAKGNPAEVAFAKEYIHTLTLRRNPDKVLGKGGECPALDDQLTSQITQSLSDYESPLLLEARTKLGIRDKSAEKPFDINVWEIEGWDENKWLDRFKLWAEKTGCTTLFVNRNRTNPKLHSFLNLSKDDAKVLLGNGNLSSEIDEREQNRIKKSFQHEYRHTQRSFASKNDRLFRAFDEACTDYGITAVYQNRKVMIETLAMTTTDFSWEDVLSSYEKDDEEAKIKIIKAIEANFGPLGVLLLGGKSSTDARNDGLDNLPTGSSANQNLAFIERMLELRASNDSSWLESFSEGVSVLSNEELQVISKSLYYLCKGYSEENKYVTEMMAIIKTQQTIHETIT